MYAKYERRVTKNIPQTAFQHLIRDVRSVLVWDEENDVSISGPQQGHWRLCPFLQAGSRLLTLKETTQWRYDSRL